MFFPFGLTVSSTLNRCEMKALFSLFIAWSKEQFHAKDIDLNTSKYRPTFYKDGLQKDANRIANEFETENVRFA